MNDFVNSIQLADGIRETTHHMQSHQADKFLSDMIKSRIGRRVIAHQHMAYCQEWFGEKQPVEGVVGMVNTRLSATKLAASLFREKYHLSPPTVTIDGHIEACLAYIPHHLEYILFEMVSISGFIAIDQKCNAAHCLASYEISSLEP